MHEHDDDDDVDGVFSQVLRQNTESLARRLQLQQRDADTAADIWQSLKKLEQQMQTLPHPPAVSAVSPVRTLSAAPPPAAAVTPAMTSASAQHRRASTGSAINNRLRTPPDCAVSSAPSTVQRAPPGSGAAASGSMMRSHSKSAEKTGVRHVDMNIFKSPSKRQLHGNINVYDPSSLSWKPTVVSNHFNERFQSTADVAIAQKTNMFLGGVR